jgi:hypothetical protein
MMENDDKKSPNVSLGMAGSSEHMDETVLLSIRSLKQWKIPEDAVVSRCICIVFVFGGVHVFAPLYIVC